MQTRSTNMSCRKLMNILHVALRGDGVARWAVLGALGGMG